MKENRRERQSQLQWLMREVEAQAEIQSVERAFGLQLQPSSETMIFKPEARRSTGAKSWSGFLSILGFGLSSKDRRL